MNDNKSNQKEKKYFQLITSQGVQVEHIIQLSQPRKKNPI